MVREKDVCWEYCERLEGNKVRCNFCQRVLNGGISRLKHHLSRLPSKGVHPCSKVRDDVTDRVRSIIALKEEGKEDGNAKKQRIEEPRASPNVSTAKQVVQIEAPSTMAKLFPCTTSTSTQLSYDREYAERSIAMFFFENQLDFSVARSSSYQAMVDAIEKCGAGIRPPSSHALKTTWLHKIKSEVQQQFREIEKEWATTGCTVIADTWMDSKSKAIINFSVSSPSGTFFHKSLDASSCYKNTKSLADLFETVIQDFGPENVVQIITDNALLNYGGVGHHITQNYSTIFWSPCASLCLNSILDDFTKVDWVNRCIILAQTISKFIYNNMWVLELMKKFTGGQEIVRTGITDATSSFLTLQAMLKHRARLKHMFNCPEYSSSPYAAKSLSISCIAYVEDDDFWRSIDELVAVSEPILKVLREVSAGKPAVGSIYELMTKAKESIRTYYIMDEGKCKTFLDIFDRRWQNQLHSSLHAAGAFLNPSIQYSTETKYLSMIKEEFVLALEKLLPTPELRHDMTSQILVFRKSQGLLGCNLARESRNTISPGLWWEQYGDSAPGLQRVAIRILSQVCSGCCTLNQNNSSFKQIHSEKRNKLDKETLTDLMYINYNTRLANRAKGKPSEVDPIVVDDIDMTSEWVEESENAITTPWLDRYSLDGAGDLNTRQFTSSLFSSSDHLFI